MPTQSRIGAADLAACRRFSAAVAAGDVAAALAESHPAIALHRPCGVLRGAAGVRTLVAGLRRADLAATVHLEGVVADGGRALARGRLDLRRTDTGELTETRPVAARLEARDGQVVRWQAIPPAHTSCEEPTMHPSAITHLAAAAIDEQRYREGELARQARAARPDDSGLARALIAMGKMAPASGLLPWLPAVALVKDARNRAGHPRTRTTR